MDHRVWTLTIDDAQKTFPTLEAATGYLGKAFNGSQKVISLESQLLSAEESRALRREDVE